MPRPTSRIHAPVNRGGHFHTANIGIVAPPSALQQDYEGYAPSYAQLSRLACQALLFGVESRQKKGSTHKLLRTPHKSERTNRRTPDSRHDFSHDRVFLCREMQVLREKFRCNLC